MTKEGYVYLWPDGEGTYMVIAKCEDGLYRKDGRESTENLQYFPCTKEELEDLSFVVKAKIV